MKAVIVVPTIREDCIVRFLQSWRDEFSDHVVIVVEDNPEPSFALHGLANVHHYSWADIDQDLGLDANLIPRRTDCVRSFGFIKAIEQVPDMIVTLDDDCYPDSDGFLAAHWNRLQDSSSPAWASTIRGAKPRGVPYASRLRTTPTVISHGLWSNVPDLDAPTQLVTWEQTGVDKPVVTAIDQIIPRGQFFPMCGMNLAFRPVMVSALYFLKMGRGQQFDRFGDIWAGLFAKKICDHLGLAVASGGPVVRHERASNVWANLRKEMAGLEINESLWRQVDQVVLTSRTVSACYMELADGLTLEGAYWSDLKDSMRRWARLCDRLAVEREYPPIPAAPSQLAVLKGASL